MPRNLNEMSKEELIQRVRKLEAGLASAYEVSENPAAVRQTCGAALKED